MGPSRIGFPRHHSDVRQMREGPIVFFFISGNSLVGFPSSKIFDILPVCALLCLFLCNLSTRHSQRRLFFRRQKLKSGRCRLVPPVSWQDEPVWLIAKTTHGLSRPLRRPWCSRKPSSRSAEKPSTHSMPMAVGRSTHRVGEDNEAQQTGKKIMIPTLSGAPSTSVSTSFPSSQKSQSYIGAP